MTITTTTSGSSPKSRLLFLIEESFKVNFKLMQLLLESQALPGAAQYSAPGHVCFAQNRKLKHGCVQGKQDNGRKNGVAEEHVYFFTSILSLFLK